MTRTRSQLFAEKAIQVVTGWQSVKEDCEELRSFSRGFPALIQTSGLLQALAYGLRQDDAKGKYVQGFVSVLTAVVRYDEGQTGDEYVDPEQFASELRGMPAEDYMRVSRFALEAASWIKRYAVMVL